MKFGLFYEHQTPRPSDQGQWGPDAEHRLMKIMRSRCDSS